MENLFTDNMFQEVQKYYNSHDMPRAGACMEYWLKQAQNASCWQEELTILNELIGFYRKTGNPEKGLHVMQRAEQIITGHELENTEAAGTTWLNIATAYRAFGKTQQSYNYFVKTKQNYLQQMEPFDYRMASLHNNMALLFLDIGYLGKAKEEFEQAIEILQTDPESEAELVTTYINLLVLVYKIPLPESQKQLALHSLIDKTIALLAKYTDLPDSYYAYVCDICAKTIISLGFSREAEILTQLSERFYHTHAVENPTAKGGQSA